MKSNKIDYSKLDPGCVSIVKYFNSHGLKTRMCCEGHNIPNMSLFWVEFSKDVSDDDIRVFMVNHSKIRINMRNEEFYNYEGLGWFCKRYEISGDDIAGRWRYVAANSTTANLDVSIWTYMDEKDYEAIRVIHKSLYILQSLSE